MDPQDEGATVPPSARTELVTVTWRARRAPGPLLWVAVLLVPVLLAGAIGYLRLSSVEDAVRANARTALKAAKIKNVGLVVDGRHVTAEVPTGGDPAEVKKVLTTVPGVAAIGTKNVYASKAEARACAEIQAKLDRATGERIPFVGQTRRLTADGRAKVRAAGRLLTACGAARVAVGGHTDPDTDNGSTLSLQRARVIVAALRRAGVAGTRLQAYGYSDQFPMTDKRTPAARARNERGTLRVETP